MKAYNINRGTTPKSNNLCLFYRQKKTLQTIIYTNFITCVIKRVFLVDQQLWNLGECVQIKKWKFINITDNYSILKLVRNSQWTRLPHTWLVFHFKTQTINPSNFKTMIKLPAVPFKDDKLILAFKANYPYTSSLTASLSRWDKNYFLHTIAKSAEKRYPRCLQH